MFYSSRTRRARFAWQRWRANRQLAFEALEIRTPLAADALLASTVPPASAPAEDSSRAIHPEAAEPPVPSPDLAEAANIQSLLASETRADESLESEEPPPWISHEEPPEGMRWEAPPEQENESNDEPPEEPEEPEEPPEGEAPEDPPEGEAPEEPPEGEAPEDPPAGEGPGEPNEGEPPENPPPTNQPDPGEEPGEAPDPDWSRAITESAASRSLPMTLRRGASSLLNERSDAEDAAGSMWLTLPLADSLGSTNPWDDLAETLTGTRATSLARSAAAGTNNVDALYEELGGVPRHNAGALKDYALDGLDAEPESLATANAMLRRYRMFDEDMSSGSGEAIDKFHPADAQPLDRALSELLAEMDELTETLATHVLDTPYGSWSAGLAIAGVLGGVVHLHRRNQQRTAAEFSETVAASFPELMYLLDTKE